MPVGTSRIMGDHGNKDRLPNMELVEIKPLIFGGDPKDPQNKTWLTRQQHIEVVRYWNREIANFKKTSS